MRCTAHRLGPLTVERTHRTHVKLHLRRDPRRPQLTPHELADWLDAAETVGGPAHAMAAGA